ncbi:MAG: response regulator [Promethearchaeota archaeon]|nr:MAG: response regulator [Candidatus Lokiarchaeota archaeon]
MKLVNIYLIEDNEDLLFTYECLLNVNGMEVIEKALDGEEAIHKYINLIDKPDLILLDYRMPKKNGLEIMNEILKISNNAKIILISADPEIEKKALENGAKRFLKKPISGEKLINEIKIQLGTV